MYNPLVPYTKHLLPFQGPNLRSEQDFTEGDCGTFTGGPPLDTLMPVSFCLQMALPLISMILRIQ